MTDDHMQVEFVDGRETFGIIVLGKTDTNEIDMQFKAITIDKLELAVLLMRAGRELKRQYDEENPTPGKEEQ